MILFHGLRLLSLGLIRESENSCNSTDSSFPLVIIALFFSSSRTTERLISTAMKLDPEKQDPFASLDGRKQSAVMEEALITVTTLKDADEALSFLENHPHAAQIAEEGDAILKDPKRLKRLVRKIDLTIAPLLAAVYFLQFLDKTTLSYTAVMGIRTDTHLKGQQYSDLGMLFYIGKRSIK